MASKGVMAVELAHDSIAGVFHFSIDENVSSEQSHFSTHVHPIYDLSSVVILWFPWAEEKGRFMLQQYAQFKDKYSAKLDKTPITWCDYNWNSKPTQLRTAEKNTWETSIVLRENVLCFGFKFLCELSRVTQRILKLLFTQIPDDINIAQQLDHPDSNCEISLIHLSKPQ